MAGKEKISGKKTVTFQAKTGKPDIDKREIEYPKERKAEIEAAKVSKVTMFGQEVGPRFTLPKGKI